MERIFLYISAIAYAISTTINNLILCFLAIPMIFCTFLFVKREERKDFTNDWFDMLNK